MDCNPARFQAILFGVGDAVILELLQGSEQGGIIGVVVLAGDDGIAQSGGLGPVVAGVLTLGHGEGQLLAEGGEGFVSLDGLISLGSDVGGTPTTALNRASCTSPLERNRARESQAASLASSVWGLTPRSLKPPKPLICTGVPFTLKVGSLAQA